MQWPALGLVCTALVCAGCVREPVLRVFDGRAESGRWVSPEAYAAFTEATLEEAQGNPKAALSAYERAIAEDPENAAAWGRIGALRCTSAPHAADEAFARAEALEPNLQSPWLARAECDLARKDARGAVTHAQRAAALSPWDDATSSVLASALERSGDTVAARRWRNAITLAAPGTRERIRRAPGREAARAELDRAFDGDDETALLRAAVSARVGTGELSLRAVARGRTGLATKLASRLLDADPTSADARIALLSSADLERDEDSFRRCTTGAPQRMELPSALGAELMEALIARRVGPDAAQAWSHSYGSAAGK